jgi:peptide/nickel transport system substrate-binding protein
MKWKSLLSAAILAVCAAQPLPAQETKRPDMVVAVEGLFRTLEPINGNSTTANRIFPNIFNSLVSRNFTEDPEGNKLVPALAVAWEQPSPKVWRLKLRQGVKFHNGVEMTSDDVAFSLSADRIWGAKALVPAGTRYTTGFVRVEAVDKYTVDIETASPDPNLLYRFITPLGYIVPKAAYLAAGPEAFGQKPIGTGPYRLTAFDPTEKVELTAFDEYWNGRPPAAKVTFKVVPEFSARLAGMVSGEFDIMVNVPVDQVDSVKKFPKLNYITQPVSSYVMLAYNSLDIPKFGPNPLTDVNLRYAMTSAIDLAKLVKSLWGDATYAPAPFNFPEFGEFYDAKVAPKYGYNIEAAKAFLRKSSYRGEQLVVNVTRGAVPNFDLAVEYMAEQWNALGIKVKLNVVDSWPLALQHPFGLLNMSMDVAFDSSPTRAIWGFWGPESARATREADRSWTPPAAFIEKGKKYLEAVDFAERKRLFREMVDIWEDEMPALIVWRNIANWVSQDRVKWTPITDVSIFCGPEYLRFAAR